MNDNNKQIALAELIQKDLDGLLTDQEFGVLESMLDDDAEAVSYYVKTMLSISVFSANSFIPFFESIAQRDDRIDIFNKDAWEALAEYEKTAPEIEIPKEKPQRELIQKVVYPPREKRKVSKFSIFFLAMNAAAILFFFLFLRFAPPKGSHEVATLVDSLNAQWADAEGKMIHGASIAASDESLFLSEGYAELVFDNQTKATIEGPAEFKILAEDQIKLIYGRLYTMVPRGATGFTVKTPSAQIVDLGTEFGVDCDFQGDTSLHVIKGGTVLIAGDKSSKVSIEVKEGFAKKVFAENQTISDISCNDHLFVREINSADDFIWRGETKMSLADIVGGGDGFGKIPSLIGLNPATGEYTSSIVQNPRGSTKAYNLVPDSKFIDGVFVPDGGQDGRIVITSLNDTFQCHDTKGKFTHEIAVYRGDIEKQHDTIRPAIFHGQKYDNNAVVMIHSNAGITFDLQAIQRMLPGLNLTHFEAFGGLSEALNIENDLPDVDFWVLVNGQIRYEKKALKLEDGEISFTVELSPQDRFLTLIVTDGSRPTDATRGYAEWNVDFFYLIDPTLYIAGSSD